MEDLRTKILIVEDEQIIALHLAQVISGFGHEVVGICDTGFDALELFDTESPDLIFVDIIINGDMSGIDFVKKVKEVSDVSIIYLTANTDVDTLALAKSTLPNAFLRKPFDNNELKTTIEMSVLGFAEKSSKINRLKKQNEKHEINIKDLMDTNAHLVTATWRERELKAELQKTKEIIEKQNQNILASINYAKRIQKSIIPTRDQFEILGDHFVFYKPKDVVSGDFPWLYDRGDYIYIAAVDCTGHGVPGAMMSLIGFLLLNDIVSDHDHYKTPAEVLNELHDAVVKTLKQDDPDNKAADGMDVALCRISKDMKEVIYAGAHRPLYHLSDGELKEYKGCKYPIGGMQYKGANIFEDQKVDTKKGDSVYFFSDGLPDQFGSNDNIKLGTKRIKDAILENGDAPMYEIKSIFYNLFHDWKGDYKQLDDVLMIGLRF